MIKQVPISSEHITLGQLLKLADVLNTGGQVKWFLEEYEILVNGEKENRRGKKLYPGDVIEIKEMGSFEVVHEN